MYQPVEFEDGYGVEKDGELIWSTTGDGYRREDMIEAVMNEVNIGKPQREAFRFMFGLVEWDAREEAVPK